MTDMILWHTFGNRFTMVKSGSPLNVIILLKSRRAIFTISSSVWSSTTVSPGFPTYARNNTLPFGVVNGHF